MNNAQEINIIGAIGDVHGEDRLLEKTIAFLKDRDVDMILCVGDIVDGEGNWEHCCHLLQQEGIQTVQGNHDRWLFEGWLRGSPDATQLDDISHESATFLQSLPNTYEFSTPDGAALLCHGLGDNVMAKVSTDDYGYAIETNMELQQLIDGRKYRYIINGHTHETMVRSFGRLTIINAGSLKADLFPGFLLVDFFRGIVECYIFDKLTWIQKSIRVQLTDDVFFSPKPQSQDLLERIKVEDGRS